MKAFHPTFAFLAILAVGMPFAFPSFAGADAVPTEDAESCASSGSGVVAAKDAEIQQMKAVVTAYKVCS